MKYILSFQSAVLVFVAEVLTRRVLLISLLMCPTHPYLFLPIIIVKDKWEHK
jgi:hypothetical protein